MGVDITDRISTVGPTDVFATHDSNRGALGFHAVNSLLERNSIPLDRRKGSYEADGASSTPSPFFVCVRTGSTIKLYWLKNEPGTDLTTNSDWEEYVATVADPFQGFFIPASSTLVNGTGVKGNYWIASVAGTFNGESYLQYDKSVYDGAVWKRVGAGSVVSDWNTMVNKPSSFTPSSHAHPISQVTGLQTSLDNKLDDSQLEQEISGLATKVPSSTAVKEYGYSRAELDSRLSNLSTYGIKFSWLNLTQMNTQTGQILGDLGLRQDKQKVYRWSGVAWDYFFTVDPNGVRINDITPSSSTTYSGTKVDYLITTHTHPNATTDDDGFMSNLNWRKLKRLPTRNSDTIELITVPILSINSSNQIASTSCTVRVAGVDYTVPANTVLGGTSAAMHIGKYFFGYITGSSGAYNTNYAVYNTLDSLPDTLFSEDQVYFGLYYYEASGVIREVSYNYVTKVKLPDGNTKVIKANGLLDLSTLSSISYTDAEAIAAAQTNIGTEATNFAAGNHGHEDATIAAAGFLSTKLLNRINLRLPSSGWVNTEWVTKNTITFSANHINIAYDGTMLLNGVLKDVDGSNNTLVPPTSGSTKVIVISVSAVGPTYRAIAYTFSNIKEFANSPFPDHVVEPLGYYIYHSDGSFTPLPFIPVTSAKLPDNSIAVPDINGELDLSALSGSGGTATTDAGDLVTGTLDDDRLSSNIPKKDASNVYTSIAEFKTALGGFAGLAMSAADTGKMHLIMKGDGTLAWLDSSESPDVLMYKSDTGILSINGTLDVESGIKEGGVPLSAKYAAAKLVLDSDITTNYTIQASDNGKLRIINSASSITITLPTGLAGIQVVLKQKGVGSFILAAGSGATIEQFEDKLKSAGQKAVVSIFAESSTVWVPNGQLIAV